MLEAAEARPGADPDRCSFTIAMETARDLIVQAVGVITLASTTTDSAFCSVPAVPATP
ncbi:hypothetical protein GCM10009574_096290 [Streptomyces asiaticus]